mmetsp:Transcript_49719/g.75101  ORF Transcript_49719/g.75101 Transcript_49719/m.75101 type:complete len:106 (-) Transcript_49719:39-356(-)
MRSWKDVLNLQGGVGVGENEMMNGTVQDEETRRREQLKYCLKKSGGHNGTLSLCFRVATMEDIQFAHRLPTTRSSIHSKLSSMMKMTPYLLKKRYKKNKLDREIR